MGQKGQNVMEFILLTAAVLAVFIIFLKPGGKMHTSMNGILTNATQGQLNMIKDEIKF